MRVYHVIEIQWLVGWMDTRMDGWMVDSLACSFIGWLVSWLSWLGGWMGRCLLN